MKELLDAEEIAAIGWPKEHRAVKSANFVVDRPKDLKALGIRECLTDSQMQAVINFLLEDDGA